MRSEAVIVAIVATAWIGSAAVADAQPPAPILRLTLAEAQARAVQASHRLAEARAREAAARAVVDARLALDRPLITASAGYSRTNHVLEFSVPGPTGPRVLYPDVPDNYRTRLDVQWPIYSGGRTDALEQAARAEAAAVASEVQSAQADLRLEVSRAFWAIVTARAAVAVLEQGLARAESHARDVAARFNAGLVAPNETASADAQVSRARMLLIESRNQRDVSTADLLRLVGAEAAIEAVEPVASLDGATTAAEADTPASPPGPPGPVTLASNAQSNVEGHGPGLLEQARATRAERQALERRIEAVDAQRLSAAAGRLPTIAAVAGVDYARPNPRIFPRADRWDDSWEVGVNVSWSLWDGGRTAADVAQASSLATAARHRLAEFDAVLGVELRQRTLDIASGRAAVQASADAVRAAAEARRVVDERYRAGVIAQGDLLDAEQALLQAELDRTRALAGVRLSEARLERAIGR
jgi:outer membrane protein